MAWRLPGEQADEPLSGSDAAGEADGCPACRMEAAGDTAGDEAVPAEGRGSGGVCVPYAGCVYRMEAVAYDRERQGFGSEPMESGTVRIVSVDGMYAAPEGGRCRDRV